MQERDSSPGFAAGHLLIAVLIAAAVAGGVYGWYRYNGTKAASTAELSFDPQAAGRIDPGIAASRQPAVAVAQSMLSDAVLAGLSKQAYLASSSMAGRVGEFRSRLQLTQASPSMLRVGFQDADPGKAAVTANTVAKALAAGSPPGDGAAPADTGAVAAGTAAPPAAPQPAASAKPAAPAQAPAAPANTQPKAEAPPEAQPSHALSDELGAVAGQLSATGRKLDGIESERGSRNEEAYRESRQQGMLRSEVRAAQKKVEDLRKQYADDSAVPDAGDRLGEIQDELGSVLSGGRGSRYNGAGIDAGQLRREREELTRATGVVERERKAIAQEEAAHPAASAADQEASGSEPGARSASSGAAAPASPSAVTETNLPPTGAAASPAQSAASATGSGAPAESPGAESSPQPASSAGGGAGGSTPSPLRVVRLAGSAPARPLWWPGALAGCVCGLLYLGVAGMGSRSVEDPEDTSIVPQRAQRMITPEGPVATVYPRESQEDGDPYEATRTRRAAFTYEAVPGENGLAAPEKAAPAVPEESETAAPAEISGPVVPQESSPVTREESAAEDAAPGKATAVAQFESELRERVAKAAPAPAPANPVVTMRDAWVEDMKRTLAQTAVGRELGEPSQPGQGAASDSGAGDDTPPSSGYPNRLAG